MTQPKRNAKESTVNLVLRLPADMHERLVTAALARRPKQSLSREILQRLEENFSHEDDVNLLRSTVESDPEFTRLWSTLMQEGGASKKFMDRFLQKKRGKK